MVKSTHIILIALIALGTMVGLYEATLFYLGYEVGERLETAWQFVAIVLLAMWIEADSRGRTNVYRPFELGFFAMYFVVPYVPYYFIKTRGVAGVFWLFGIVVLLWLGYWLQWLVYLAS